MAALIENIYDKIAGEKTVPTSTPAHPILDDTTKMHALVWNGKEDMRYQEVPKPLLTDPRDILLRVTSSSICGSDLHLYSGTMKGMKSGDIVGHEFMGVIEEVGKDVHKLHVGQRVVVAFDIACGSCEYCQKELYTSCDTTNPSTATEEMYGHRTGSFYGYSHITGGVPGGQSEFVRVSFAEMNCLPIPDDVPDEKALFLSDLVPTAYHGTELANVKEGDIVGIWGLGPIGLLAAKWCFLRKAKMVIGVECVPERMELAKKIGVHVIDFSKGDAVKEIFDLVPAGLDSAIECAGYEYPSTWLHKVERALSLETDTADIITQCITTVKKCGTVSIIGVYTGYTNHFPIGALMEKGITLNGGQSPTQKYWKMALEKIRSGELDPTFVVTHTASLADGPQLYEKFYKREDGIIKVFLQPENMISRKEAPATQS